MKNRYKYFYILITIMILIFSSCSESPKSYNKRINKTLDLLNKFENESLILASFIQEAWHENIFGSKIYNGKYESDFNVSINRAKQENNTLIDSIKYHKIEIDKISKELIDPPEKSENIYKQFKDLYGYYSEITDLSLNPRGSYVTYLNSLNDLISKYKRNVDELKIIIPE